MADNAKIIECAAQMRKLAKTGSDKDAQQTELMFNALTGAEQGLAVIAENLLEGVSVETCGEDLAIVEALAKDMGATVTELDLDDTRLRTIVVALPAMN